MAKNTCNPQMPTHSSPSSESESEYDQTHVSGSDVEEEKSGSDSQPKQKPETLIPPPKSPNKFQNPSQDFDSTKSAKKRHASASENQKPAKKKKKKNDSKEKLQMFQRLWSEDDEIVILKGLIKYKKQNNGVVAICADMHDFHNYIKNKLHVDDDVTTSQLVNKIRKLKKKYENNARKEKNGRDRSSLKPHELKCYGLSKSIWATDNVAGASNQNEKSKGSGIDINQFVKYASSYNGDVVLVEEIVKVGMELIEGFKRKEIKEKWNELKKEELELCVKRYDFVSTLTKVVLEAL